MFNKDKELRPDTYTEIVFTNEEKDKHLVGRNNFPSVSWYEENKVFSSMYEAQEYISSEVYPEILHNYNGYKTTDLKLASSLLFELMKIRTNGYLTREVYADIDVIDKKLYYLVWISSE